MTTVIHDRKCGQCGRRRLVEPSTDTGTVVFTAAVELWFCKACMDEARESLSLTSMVDEALKWKAQEAEWEKGK